MVVQKKWQKATDPDGACLVSSFANRVQLREKKSIYFSLDRICYGDDVVQLGCNLFLNPTRYLFILLRMNNRKKKVTESFETWIRERKSLD